MADRPTGNRYRDLVNQTVVVLATLTHPAIDGPFRMACSHWSDVVSRGHTFAASGFHVAVPPGDDAEIRVELNGLAAAIGPRAGLDLPVKLELVHATAPDEVLREITGRLVERNGELLVVSE